VSVTNGRRAREAFDAAGYTLDAIVARLGPQVFAQLAAGEVAPLEWGTRSGDRLDLLARLFVVGGPVPVRAAAAALAPLPVDGWLADRLIAVEGDHVRGLVVVRPLGDPDESLVVHDRPAPPGSVPADHVLGVSVSTTSLAGATIRRPVDAAFDLGTGCGVQAVHAAAHSRRVVASDINPRAVALATVTMELNHLDHVHVRRGDRFDPVQDERFDLIVANPPFVISPSRRYMFRDSGLPLDELCRSIVAGAPDHLQEGGHCQLLASWAHVAGEDWRDRLAGWFAGTGCDALVLEREAVEPARHVTGWLRQTEPPERWGDEFDAWMEHCARHDIEAIGFGLITMRRRPAGPNWFRVEEATQDVATPCGDHLGAAFELADLLTGLDDRALLDEVLVVAPDVVLDERHRPTPGGWEVTGRRLRQLAGLRYDGDVDPAVAAIVAGCDGERPLGAILADAATSAGVGTGELTAAALPMVRRLVERAFLLPVLGG
jgi:Methyltransferase small domain